MDQLIVAFVTGLTTGGLSCLAVQGGLLASSLGRQIEQDMLAARSRRKGTSARRPELALPIALFLAAKLAAYTLLGLLLGALGSVLQLTASMRAFLLIAIGIFMLGNALRMLNVHPFFRIFNIEPPKAVTRYIRRTAKQDADWFTPIFLGALTVLIPCGVTQAMMAVAIGSGSPVQGALLMFAFTLGTSPVFFAVAYLTTAIGARLEKWFMRFVAVVVLVLGLLSVDAGLTLMGSRYTLANLMDPPQSAPAGLSAYAGSESIILLNALNDGYSPRRLLAPADQAVTLNVVTDRTYSCARAFVIPALGIEVLLPASGTVPIQIPPQPEGTQMAFTCSMGMYTGVINFTR